MLLWDVPSLAARDGRNTSAVIEIPFVGVELGTEAEEAVDKGPRTRKDTSVATQSGFAAQQGLTTSFPNTVQA